MGGNAAERRAERPSRGVGGSPCAWLATAQVWVRLVLAAHLALLTAGGSRADEPPPASAQFATETLRGRVVYLAEVMDKRLGVPWVPEAKDRILALETTGGRLIPLVEDSRGRAFRRDPRLRAMNLELMVRRYDTSPAVQIIRVCEVTPAGRFELDYWCEICSIAMFENKDCECCQGPVELRRRMVP